MNYAEKLGKNTIYNSIGSIVGMISSFIIIAILSRGLNESEFGLLYFGYAIAGIIIFFYLGMPQALTTYTSKCSVEKNEKLLQKMCLTANAILLLTSLTAFIFLMALSSRITYIFNIPDILLSQANFMIMVVAVSFLLAPFKIIFSSILTGLQRFDVLNLISILIPIINIFFIYSIITFTLGFRNLVIYMFILSSLVMIATLFYTCNRASSLSYLRLVKPSKEIVKMLVMLSFPAFIIFQLGGFVFLNLDSILLAAYMPVKYVGFYKIATSLANFLCVLPGLAAAAGFPLISELNAKGDKERIKNAYTRFIRYLYILLIPGVTGLIALSPSIISIWVGPNFLEAIHPLRILSIGYVAIAFASAWIMILLGIGELSKAAIFSTLAILIAIILGIILIPKFGMVGAALMITIPQLIVQPFQHGIVIQKFGIKRPDLQFSTLFKSIGSALFMFIILNFIPCANLWQLIISISFGALIYFTVFYALEGFNMSDITLIKGLFTSLGLKPR